jgi:cation diffusion facilitator family transporter
MSKAMMESNSVFQIPPHDHFFLGSDHDRAERRNWAVIILCTVMMVAEIVGGALFGSLALIADGLHMSTHAGALLLAALAYTYARKYAGDRSFTFGTGKFGDLAGYSSAIVLAMIALLVGYEAVTRLIDPVPIAFNQAIPIAVLGLVVNAASAWLLSGGLHHRHDHDHSHGHAHGHDHDGAPRRSDEPEIRELEFEEHDHGHGAHHRDNNMRAAVVHVMADAAVSVLVIVGLLLARAFDWLWMDPLAGFIGALVIANWSVGLLRDTGAILLDRNPDPRMAERVRTAIESEGDHVTDLHLWRLGPGHLGAIVSVATSETHEPAHYRKRLARFPDLSHITVEVQHRLATP